MADSFLSPYSPPVGPANFSFSSSDFSLSRYTPPSSFAANFLFGSNNFSLSLYTPPASTAANFPLSPIDAVSFLLGLAVSGKLGRADLPDPLGVYGIWQMRMTKRGKVPIRMKFYTPTNPQTVPQQANRQKFADAMSAWGALTPEQKNVYNERAKKRQMFGWGLFIREYYQSN